ALGPVRPRARGWTVGTVLRVQRIAVREVADAGGDVERPRRPFGEAGGTCGGVLGAEGGERERARDEHNDRAERDGCDAATTIVGHSTAPLQKRQGPSPAIHHLGFLLGGRLTRRGEARLG